MTDDETLQYSCPMILHSLCNDKSRGGKGENSHIMAGYWGKGASIDTSRQLRHQRKIFKLNKSASRNPSPPFPWLLCACSLSICSCSSVFQAVGGSQREQRGKHACDSYRARIPAQPLHNFCNLEEHTMGLVILETKFWAICRIPHAVQCTYSEECSNLI